MRAQAQLAVLGRYRVMRLVIIIVVMMLAIRRVVIARPLGRRSRSDRRRPAEADSRRLAAKPLLMETNCLPDTADPHGPKGSGR
jgi:hypothetical protein